MEKESLPTDVTAIPAGEEAPHLQARAKSPSLLTGQALGTAPTEEKKEQPIVKHSQPTLRWYNFRQAQTELSRHFATTSLSHGDLERL